LIGVYGGTFDPPHLGHLHLIKSLLERFSFESFYVIPANRNPLKVTGPSISPEQRLELLNISLEKMKEKVSILDWEIHQQKPSYTIDTLRHLRKKHPKQNLYFILGDDAFVKLPQWKEAKELVRFTNWIVVSRVKTKMTISSQFLESLAVTDARWENDSILAYCQDERSIQILNIEALPYSSSDLRCQIRDLWKMNELASPPLGIQDSVWKVIKEKRLYSV